MEDDGELQKAGRAPCVRGLGAVLVSLLVAACPWATADEAKSSLTLDLSGTWAELKILSDRVSFPLVGELSRTTTLIQRATLVQTDSRLAMVRSYCSANFDNGPALATQVDPAFVRSLDLAPAEAEVAASSAPVRFVQAWSTEIHGVRLANPETDSLPTSARDPRVFDQDGDGKPGITVRACAFGSITGDVYVVERFRTRLVGTVVSSDRIEGLVEGTVEQVILGATNALFVGTISSRPDPVAERSRFVLQRIDPDWTCSEVFPRSTSLFGS